MALLANNRLRISINRLLPYYLTSFPPCANEPKIAVRICRYLKIVAISMESFVVSIFLYEPSRDTVILGTKQVPFSLSSRASYLPRRRDLHLNCFDSLMSTTYYRRLQTDRDEMTKMKHRHAYPKVKSFLLHSAMNLDCSMYWHIVANGRFSFSKSNRGKRNGFYGGTLASITSRTGAGRGAFLCARILLFSGVKESLRCRSLSRRPRDTALYPELDMVSESFRIRCISTA